MADRLKDKDDVPTPERDTRLSRRLSQRILDNKRDTVVEKRCVSDRGGEAFPYPRHRRNIPATEQTN